MHKFPRIKVISKLMVRNYSPYIIFHSISVERTLAARIRDFHWMSFIKEWLHFLSLSAISLTMPQGIFLLWFFRRKRGKKYFKWASFVLLLRYVRFYRVLICNDCFHRTRGWDLYNFTDFSLHHACVSLNISFSYFKSHKFLFIISTPFLVSKNKKYKWRQVFPHTNELFSMIFNPVFLILVFLMNSNER